MSIGADARSTSRLGNRYQRAAEIKRSRTVNLWLHLGSHCDSRHLDRIEARLDLNKVGSVNRTE